MVDCTISPKLQRFVRKYPIFPYKKGDSVIHPGDTPSNVFYIEEGFIRVYTTSEEGNETTYIIYKPGEFFPLVWFFGERKIIYSYYLALSHVKVRKIDCDDFNKFIKINPDILLELNVFLCSVVNVLNDRISCLEYTKAYSRVISCILSLAKRFGRELDEGTVVRVPLTHTDISSSVGMTRETSSRQLERLFKKGLISCHNHLIFIKDVEELKDELSKKLGNIVSVVSLFYFVASSLLNLTETYIEI